MDDLGLRALSCVGLAVMIAIAWAISLDRKSFPTRVVIWGVTLQIAFALVVLKTAVGLFVFSVLNDAFVRLLDFTAEGSRFLFGPYLEREFTVALNVLPTIIFFSTLMSVLYHAGIMQRIVRGMAWAMQRTLKTSGAETLSAAANIFVGQTEAPLVVKPFVATMTLSELMAIMVPGFASVAGGVLAAYVGILNARFPNIAGHLLASSVMSAPASLLIAKVIVPEKEISETAGKLEMPDDKPHANVLDAAAGGASDGLALALNVAAMLVAFIALVAMVDFVLALPAYWHNQSVWTDVLRSLHSTGAVVEGCDVPNTAAKLAECIAKGNDAVGGNFEAWQAFSLERMLGWVFWPVAFVMGVPLEDCTAVATLLGEKTVLNEFVAYLHLAENLGSSHPMGPRAALLTSYALCGFANFSSIAIQIGGIGALAPSRRGDLARLGLRAMVGGMLATNMTACIAGILM